MKNNPFAALNLTIKPKALVQYSTFEAQQVTVESRIEIIAKIYFSGYDLMEVVMGYLESKDSLNDELMKDEIIQTINQYTYEILGELIEKYCNSPDVVKLYKTFFGENDEPGKLRDAIDALEIVIKEKYTI